jgi:hypothetical protein
MQQGNEKVLATSGYSAEIVEEMAVDSVWAANKVSFALHTLGKQQFIAYYNSDRMMTIASRTIGSNGWTKKILPNQLRWDSHNYVALGVDAQGYLHLSGNMHADPLVYYRSTKPYDVSSMVEINRMVGKEENRVTYPKFFTDKDSNLYFSYRIGGSGNGNILINRFNPATGTWQRYLTKPLFRGTEGNNSRSAYHKFLKDRAGNFHYVWMWRWSPLVETNHQLCYATSTDLIHWKNAAGDTVSLPLKPDNEKLIVDNTPTKGGLHNGSYQLILTPNNAPLIGYTKYDEQGLTQLYLAYFRRGQWIPKKISHWDFRWEFIGGGDQMTRGGDFQMEGFSPEGLLLISWETEQGDSGTYTINPETLDVLEKEIEVKPRYPKAVFDRFSEDPGLSVSLANDAGNTSEPGISYVLKWETMPKSHASHAPATIPSGPVTPLKLLKIRIEEDVKQVLK